VKMIRFGRRLIEMRWIGERMQVKVIMSCDDNPYYLDFWPLSCQGMERKNRL
jgi:hypothetical protein